MDTQIFIDKINELPYKFYYVLQFFIGVGNLTIQFDK